MSFINPDQYNFNLSQVRPKDIKCGPVSTEDVPGKTANTESGLTIELEPSCEPVYEIDCTTLCRENSVDSGSFTISNSCSMPLTITGFKMTDPERFSIFKFPDYTGVKVYHSGIIEELPFTLEPDQKKQINTFFHPFHDELITGKESTILNRTGDQFGSFIKIKPGFPILNCEDGDSCRPQIILTGEFLCENQREDRSWMSNCENYEDKQIGNMPIVITTPCVPHSSFASKEKINVTRTNGYDTLVDLSTEIENNLMLSQDWISDPYLPWVSSLRIFKELLRSTKSSTYDPIYVSNQEIQSFTVLSFKENVISSTIKDEPTTNTFISELPKKNDDDYNGSVISMSSDGTEYTVIGYEAETDMITVDPNFDPVPEIGDQFRIDVTNSSIEFTRDINVNSSINGEDEVYEYQSQDQDFPIYKGIRIRNTAISSVESNYLIEDSRIYFAESTDRLKMSIFLAKDYNIDNGLCPDNLFI